MPIQVLFVVKTLQLRDAIIWGESETGVSRPLPPEFCTFEGWGLTDEKDRRFLARFPGRSFPCDSIRFTRKQKLIGILCKSIRTSRPYIFILTFQLPQTGSSSSFDIRRCVFPDGDLGANKGSGFPISKSKIRAAYTAPLYSKPMFG